jgi:hypothetical protein
MKSNQLVYLLHNIGERHNSNYNTRDEILKTPIDSVLTFDGIYLNVYENHDILLGREVIFFVMGNYIGKDNSFDIGQPFERYCNWKQIREMSERIGAKIGWHTWSHPNLTTIKSDMDVIKEITPPFPMDHFAYPYGDVDDRVARLVKEVGFTTGWSVTQGDDSQFKKRRKYLNW